VDIVWVLMYVVVDNYALKVYVENHLEDYINEDEKTTIIAMI